MDAVPGGQLGVDRIPGGSPEGRMDGADADQSEPHDAETDRFLTFPKPSR